MSDLQAATFLLQWAAGGWVFLWVTTRRRQVGLGYGWLMRGIFLAMAAGAVVAGLRYQDNGAREVLTAAMVVVGLVALGLSIHRRGAGVAGQRDQVERRSQRIADMTGIDRDEQRFDKTAAEFPPVLDLVTAVIGMAALVPAADGAGGSFWLILARLVVGALFLGAVSDAMMLGHWYLVQPGLARSPLLELVRWTAITWPFELLVMLLPTGMWSVINGTIDDSYNGLLGWFWIACVVTTIGLVAVTRAALRERQYAAVMAATGLLYLAILTAFGMDLVARALLTV